MGGSSGGLTALQLAEATLQKTADPRGEQLPLKTQRQRHQVVHILKKPTAHLDLQNPEQAAERCARTVEGKNSGFPVCEACFEFYNRKVAQTRRAKQ